MVVKLLWIGGRIPFGFTYGNLSKIFKYEHKIKFILLISFYTHKTSKLKQAHEKYITSTTSETNRN